MTSDQPAVEPTADEIHDQMAETRSDLAEKVHALQDEVVGLAHDATTAVGEAIEGVRAAVQASVDSAQDAVAGTMGSVRHALDVGGHVRRNPWFALAGAVALGFVCGRLLRR